MKKINTDVAPKAVGPYSQAIESNGFLFLSGMLGLVPEKGEFEDNTVETQAKQACENIKALLESQGLSLENVVKTTIFLDDIKDFGKVNEIYGEYFSHKPARSAFEVANLPLEAKIEIEVIAEAN